MTRALATIERLEDVRPHPNADRLELANVRGWQVVVGKGEFRSGDQVVFFEIDTALPVTDKRFAFLAERSARVYGGISVHVLRTAKLRGEYSQGLVIHSKDFEDELFISWDHAGWTSLNNIDTGTDVTDLIPGISLWEPQTKTQGAQSVGLFPRGLLRTPKTDTERVQNLPKNFFSWFNNTEDDWLCTEKVDGSSATFGVTDDGEFVMASHNMHVAPEGNTIWKQIADRYDFANQLPPGTTLQGEIYGEGIQKNPLGIKGIELAVFAVYDHGVVVHPYDWPRWHPPEMLKTSGQYAPFRVDVDFPLSREDAIADVDGLKSQINPDRLAEGVVWTYYGPDDYKVMVAGEEGPEQAYYMYPVFPCHALGERLSFKVISNAYLLKVKG